MKKKMFECDESWFGRNWFNVFVFLTFFYSLMFGLSGIFIWRIAMSWMVLFILIMILVALVNIENTLRGRYDKRLFTNLDLKKGCD